MILRIAEKISVITLFDRTNDHLRPLRISWRNRDYSVTKIGFHHREKRGRILHHIFSVIAGSLFFKLSFDTEHLDWVIEEVSDGLTD